MKIFIKLFTVMFFAGLLSLSFAQAADITFYEGDHIKQTGNGYGTGDCTDYGIDVIVSGTYDFTFTAVNSWKIPSGNADDDEKNRIKQENLIKASMPKFDVLIDGTPIMANVIIPSTDGEKAVFSKQANLLGGKHKLTIRSKASDWEMENFYLTLVSANQRTGYTLVPGDLTLGNYIEKYKSRILGGGLKMDPGNYANYNIYAEKSGIYNITITGNFPGIDSSSSMFDKYTGDAVRILIDGREVAVLTNEVVNATSLSGEIEIPRGCHDLELYNNGGHFSISAVNISFESEKKMDNITTTSLTELNKKDPENFDYEYSEEDKGMSIEDAKDNIAGFIGKLIAFFVEIFTKLFTPVMDIFSETLSDFLTSDTEESSIIRTLANMVIDILTMYVRTWMFEILLELLKVVDALMVIFNIFAGTKDIVASGQRVILFNYIFENQAVQRVFWGIFLVGTALNIIFAIITVAKASVTDDEEKSVKATIKEIARGALSYVMIPIFVVFSVNLASVVLKKTDDIISVSASDTELTFGNTLFMTFSMGEETSAYKDCSKKPSFTDEAREKFYNNNELYKSSSNSGKIFDFSFQKLILALAISVFIIIMLFLSVVMFATRIFDVILLFIVSPYFAASIPIDNGEKFKKWRMTFIAKLISGFGLVVMMKIFVAIVLPVILGGGITLSATWIADIGLKLLLLTGGMYAVFKSHNLLMQIINPQLALAEMGIAEVGVSAAKEVAGLVKSEAGGKAGGGSGGLTNQQKTIASMK